MQLSAVHSGWTHTLKLQPACSSSWVRDVDTSDVRVHIGDAGANGVFVTDASDVCLHAEMPMGK